MRAFTLHAAHIAACVVAVASLLAGGCAKGKPSAKLTSHHVGEGDAGVFDSQVMVDANEPDPCGLCPTDPNGVTSCTSQKRCVLTCNDDYVLSGAACVVPDPCAGIFRDAGADGGLAIMPEGVVLSIVAGSPVPTQTFVASFGDSAITPMWRVDRGEIGTITADGVFTPTGVLGGTANVTANYGTMSISTLVTVTLANQQNGDPNFGAAPPFGPSGYAGVGGDGPGGPTTSAQQRALTSAPTADSQVQILYPYDATLWPRDLLPPLLQWTTGTHHFDAMRIHVEEDFYEYDGFFAAPSSDALFENLPIPKDAWRELTYSNEGEPVTVEITFAEGANAFGPYTLHWNIAPGSLRGIVYYNSYGTALVDNWMGGLGVGGDAFGGATLAIKPAATGFTAASVDPPALIAGSSGADGCRVCHSVSANGAVLMTQQGKSNLDFNQSSFYALTAGNVETSLLSPQAISFSALFPDGSLMLTGSAQAVEGNENLGSWLAEVPTGMRLDSTGLPDNFHAAFPAFSPDGLHVAYNDNARGLGVSDFDRRTHAFTNMHTLEVPPLRSDAVFPSFMPSNDALVYAIQTGENGLGVTTNRSELWYVDLLTMTTARLDAANGRGALPSNPNGHQDDATLNYEPTVSPLSSGGYAWVVFTSRRLYGNIATISPMTSDPRTFDWLQDITPKKLWVAAIDLHAAPGTDPSHPAFYLPAQELHAGNSRGVWAVDPLCRANGARCTISADCCAGYCTPKSNGDFVCAPSDPICR